jgi:17beta-estradiol 17-dehydrogenase / very-long-chain 3-oxoacyl-CoA reductase
VQTKTFVIDFASADEARWEALLDELKPIEVGVLGTSLAHVLSVPFSNVFFLWRTYTLWTVNNVGVSHEFPTDFIDTPPEELVAIKNVNVSATLRITSLIAPSMVSRCASLSIVFGVFDCALTP